MSRAADLELASVVKRYGDSVAVDRHFAEDQGRHLLLSAGTLRLRQNFDAADDRRA